ncbi:MAG: amidophosphoribosyltransferase [Acidobacteriota bacterium]
MQFDYLSDLSRDKFKEECGVFGIFGHREAANITYLGLYGLQHRGQESAGIVSSDALKLHREVGMGYVAEVFQKANLKRLRGEAAIGHVRYSTAGESKITNAQPIKISCNKGEIALSHNGNLVNGGVIKSELERDGSIFQSTSDTEVILHLIARSKEKDLVDAIVDALNQLTGAFSLAFLTKDKMIAVRDPRGFRPLSIGKLDGSYVVASESCAFDLIGAQFQRDIEPGEIVVFNSNGMKSYRLPHRLEATQCIFEYIYFARPDSFLFGRTVNIVRKRLGVEMARETEVDADLIVPVPDSGVCAASGFSEHSGIPMEFALIRNHYVGRTFIEPKQAIRHFGVKVKLNPVRELLKGKRVILIDDSIVRGTTSRKIVSMVREAGAKEVHLRISCAPTKSPCYYGIDTPLRSELIASSHTIPEICRYVRADSLGYLSLDGMFRAVENGKNEFCTACYTCKYPVDFPQEDVSQLLLFEKPR